MTSANFSESAPALSDIREDASLKSVVVRIPGRASVRKTTDVRGSMQGPVGRMGTSLIRETKSLTSELTLTKVDNMAKENISNLTDDQISKLPKYAQTEIDRLAQNVIYYKDKLRSGEERDTEVFVQHSLQDDIGLPRGSHIRFQLANGNIEAYVGDEGLELFAGGAYHLAFKPRSANHGVLAVEDRR